MPPVLISWQQLAPGCGLFRFHEKPTHDPLAAFCGVCTAVVIEDEAWLWGMLGRVRLPHFVEMARWGAANGVTRVFAERAHGRRRLPLFEPVDGILQVTLVSDWMARFGAAAA